LRPAISMARGAAQLQSDVTVMMQPATVMRIFSQRFLPGRRTGYWFG